jgi:hypothetical protein
MAFIVSVVTILFSTNEDHWLRAPLTTASVPLLLLLVVAALAEFVHGMRWIDDKAIIAAAHFVVVMGVVTILGLLLWQMRVVQAAREQLRAEEAARAEAAKLEAARAADAQCEKERLVAIERATKRRADAGSALQRCLREFERSRTIFTISEPEQYCRTKRVSLSTTQRELDTAKGRICSTGAK